MEKEYIQGAYQVLLFVHSNLRWAVLLLGVWACLRYIRGYFREYAFLPLDNRAGRFYITILHTQIFLGILMTFLGPIHLWDLPDGWMKISAVRFRFLEHPVTMFVGFMVARVGRGLSLRAKSDKQKFARGALLYTLSMVLLIGGMPWSSGQLYRGF